MIDDNALWQDLLLAA